MKEKRTAPAWPTPGPAKPDTKRWFVVDVSGTFSGRRHIEAELGQEHSLAKKVVGELEAELQDLAGFALSTEMGLIEVKPDAET